MASLGRLISIALYMKTKQQILLFLAFVPLLYHVMKLTIWVRQFFFWSFFKPLLYRRSDVTIRMVSLVWKLGKSVYFQTEKKTRDQILFCWQPPPGRGGSSGSWWLLTLTSSPFITCKGQNWGGAHIAHTVSVIKISSPQRTVVVNYCPANASHVHFLT